MSNIRELSQLASVIVVDNNNKNVGIGSTLPGSKLSVDGDVYISGNTRIVGILSVGSGTVTIDGDNGVIGVGTVTLTESQVSQLDDLTGDDGNFSGNVSVAGSITATTFYGDSSNLTGLFSNVVEDTTPQLGGNLDLNGNNITGSGNIDITGNIDVNGNLNVDGVLTYEDVTNVDSIGIVTARKGITVESGYGINVVSGVVTATTFEGNVTGTASNSSQLDSQLPSYYLNYNNLTNTPTIPTNNNQLTNGAGYITSADGGNAATLDSQLPSYYLNYNNLTNTPTIPTNNNQLTNGAGYITSADGGNAATLDSQLPSYYLNYNNFTNTPTIPTNNNELTNGAGYITGITGESLGNLSDVSTSGATNGQVLTYNGTSWAPVSGGGSDADTLDGQDGTYYLNYNNFTNTPTIPTNNNELTNGAGYITSADGGNAATLDSQLPSYYLDYNNFSNTPTIPTNNNQLTNGAGYITSADGGNAAQLDSQLPSYYLDYNNFSNTPTIPTNNNQLTNGAGYITSADNAATANSSPLLSSLGNYVWSASSLPTSFNQGIQCSFVQGSNGWQNYGSIMNMRTYGGGGGSLQLYVPYSPTYGGNSLQVRFGNYDSASGNSWTSWKTLWDSGNDGSGSGLDADLLDGIDSTQFLRSDAAATASGAITLSVDTTDALNFSANTTDDNRGIAFNARTALSADYNDGWLRINNTSEFTNGVYTPGNFRVDGVMRVDATRGITDVTGQYGTIQTNGSGVGNYEGYSIDGRAVFMHDGTSSTGLYNDVNNHWLLYAVHNAATDLRYAGNAKITTTSTGVSVTGDVNSTSDIKLKKNIETIDNALDKVLKLHGVYFDWKEEEIGNSRNIGFIAQEVEEVLPEVVTEIQREVRDGKGVDSKVIETESIKNVSYGNITALLVEAMKEQQKQIEALNERIRVLEGQ